MFFGTQLALKYSVRNHPTEIIQIAIIFPTAALQLKIFTRRQKTRGGRQTEKNGQKDRKEKMALKKNPGLLGRSHHFGIWANRNISGSRNIKA